jgi:hypothetical protein
MATAAVNPLLRDERIDAIRGLCLVVMTWDHLPNPFREFTYQTFGFVSAAETFVFLSGIVSAWVYGRVLIRQGMDATIRRALRRVWVIYLTHMTLFTFFGLCLLATSLHAGTVYGLTPLRAWIEGALFLLRPPWLENFLPNYCLFLAAAPIILKQLERGRYALVLTVSASLWVLAQFSEQFVGGFNPLAWQVLFVAGMAVAFPRVAGKKTPIERSSKWALVALALTAFFFVIRHRTVFHLPVGMAAVFYLNFLYAVNAKSAFHWVRLVNFASMAYLVWSIPRQFEAWASRSSIYRALAFLGRHSLQVFAGSTVVAISTYIYWERVRHFSASVQALIMVLATAGLFIPAWIHESMERSDSGLDKASRTLTVRPLAVPGQNG